MSDDIEKVDLDESATDAIAEAVAAKITLHEPERPDPDVKALRDEIAELKALMTTPKRTEIEPGGIMPKPGETQPIYGGDDVYTLTGDSDADVAVNMYLLGEVIKLAPEARHRTLSGRAHQVMLAAGERALRAAPSPIVAPGHRDHGAFLKFQFAADRADAIKAMVSTTAGSGDEWVPTFATAELWRDIHLATTVAGQIRRVDMPTNPYDLPTETADVTFYYASTENVAVTASNPTTNKATLTAAKIQAEVDFSGEVTEDSIIPIVPTLRANLVRRGAQVIDDLVVSGDTQTGATLNVNSDDAAPAAGSFYLAFNGMRKFAITTNTAQKKDFAAAPTTTLFNNTRALLLKYGARPSDLIAIMPTSTQIAFQDVTGFKLAYEYGPNATVLTGELAKVFGIPVLGYEAIPGTSVDKVDTDGKYTTTSPSTNDTKGWFVLANTGMWVSGFRRGLQIESFRDIQKDQNILVASFRMALASSGIATTHTAVGYDITV